MFVVQVMNERVFTVWVINCVCCESKYLLMGHFETAEFTVSKVG